jgi:SAM-dependent methyltransferase
MGVLEAAARRLAPRRSRGTSKRARELAYWRERRSAHGALELSNAHYAWCFTDCFGLPLELYDGKRLLDVGCGPRGSLEWAERAAERVGLDPLADEYRQLHSREHAMTYVAAPAEAIPFPDGHFDLVATMNSLDHVDDLERTVAELTRVTRRGGLALILTDVNHPPTPTEPQSFSWDVLDRFRGGWRVIDRRDYERHGDNMNDNLRAATPYDHSTGEGRPGVLAARLERSVTR